MTREGLHRIRSECATALAERRTAGADLLVGMGTSGIASGARETLAALREEIAEQSIEGVSVRQTGSLGLDHAEPTVEVRVPGMPTIIYGKVGRETAQKIIRKHLLGKTLVNDHIFDRPAADINV